MPQAEYKIFFSSRGITENAGILESNEQECGIKQCMIKNSDTKYYICDKSKIGRIGFAKLAEFDTIDYFITEKGLDKSFDAIFKEAKVKVIEV